MGSEQELLDLVLHALHLVVDGALGRSDHGGGHDVARDAARSAEVRLLGDVDVGHVLKGAMSFGAFDLLYPRRGGAGAE